MIGLAQSGDEWRGEIIDGIRKVQLYTQWPARSHFLCGGRCITGGEVVWPCAGISCPFLVTWCMLLVPGALYFFVSLPRIIEWENRLAWSLPLASLVLFSTTVGFLLATSCTDPGIIPRRPFIRAMQTEEQELRQLHDALRYDILGPEGLEPAGDEQEDARTMVPEGLRLSGYRWCRTCEIVRPPRASHCRDCDHCVLRFDHHCPFVNNCIGQRNYHFFMGFTTCALIWAAIALPVLLYTLTGEAVDLPLVATSWLRVIAVVTLVGMLLAVALLFGLWLYHLHLVFTGQTTRENLRPRRAPILNEEPALCAPRGPRLFNPRAWVSASVLAGAMAECSRRAYHPVHTRRRRTTATPTRPAAVRPSQSPRLHVLAGGGDTPSGDGTGPEASSLGSAESLTASSSNAALAEP
mmetsp:Transcript_19082/g.42709  ORF Transcript_19082/g.42709 Transcript_19082/m.42709 type:complete len:409 (-) Transcript_19082:34-1260(-)